MLFVEFKNYTSPVVERLATWSSQEGGAGSSAHSAKAPGAEPRPAEYGTRGKTCLEHDVDTYINIRQQCLQKYKRTKTNVIY